MAEYYVVDTAPGPVHEGFKEDCTGADEVFETLTCDGPVYPVCTNVVPRLTSGMHLPPPRPGPTNFAFTELSVPNAVAMPITAPDERVEPPRTASGPGCSMMFTAEFMIPPPMEFYSVVSGPE